MNIIVKARKGENIFTRFKELVFQEKVKEELEERRYYTKPSRKRYFAAIEKKRKIRKANKEQ